MYRCVVAKYKEDISWTENLPAEITIVNKDPDDNRFVFNLPNTGRESDSYCNYILRNYETISPEDRILFLQGNPSDHVHIKEIQNHLPINGKPVKRSHLPLGISNRWTYIHHGNMFICYKNGIYNKYNVPNKPTGAWDFATSFCEYLEIPQPNYFVTYNGAQWCVPGKYILNKSKSWWEKALSAHYDQDEDSNFVAGYVFEILWNTIWYHSDTEN